MLAEHFSLRNWNISSEKMRKRRVCVVGAGVIGLSTAVRVQETVPDVDVTLVADTFSPNTTSDGSGGFWLPHDLSDTPERLIKEWGKETFDHLLKLARSSEAASVHAQLLSGFTLSNVAMKEPYYKDIVLGFRTLTEEELKLFPSTKSGYFHTTVQVDVQSYLTWLMKRFKDHGGKVEFQTISSINQLETYDIVVNCCGLRGGVLGDDVSVFPVRGQIIRVTAPWVKHFYLFWVEGREGYIIPGTRNIVLGGTEQANRWDETVNEEDTQTIWKKVIHLVPSLKHAKVECVWAGLRPVRPAVRLEAEKRQTRNKTVWIVHNYGHGGSGVTLHWGCAQHAAQLVSECLHQQGPVSRL